ncbi:hypothetical protein [Caproicibacterium amylolyticum]|uniref:Uncharacterized protein n=1 Tax=Caproicibacterium amylolyticum TaxID=2766537 RepID=A0A7G9WJE3_9FIRM|nr:hypothetical protein [Caproicibacterium amylolyticum]QNO18805.1 hypothetical protein H6X83_03995 [Caproicibacterium amylolyticum]
MATTIKFANGSTFPAVSVLAGQTYMQNAQRKTLEIHIKKSDADFATLDAATQNPASFTVSDGTCDNVYNNYSLRAGLALKPIVTAQATDTAPEQTEDQYIVTLAQLSYIEVQLAAILAAQGGTK